MSARRVLVLSQEVHPVPPTRGAAVEQWMDAVAHRMERWQPMIVSVPHPLRPNIENQGRVHYRRIAMSRLYKRLFRKLTRIDPWSYLDRVAAVARTMPPDLIHLHNAPGFVDGLTKRLPGVPLVLHMHNEMRTEFRSKVAAVVGCSRYIAEYYRKQHISTEHFAVLPNGVDTDCLQPISPEEKAALRAKFDIPADRFVVMFVGRMSHEKGPDIAVSAISLLDPGRYHLAMLGEWRTAGRRGDSRSDYSVELSRLVSNRQSQISILGHFPPEESQRLYGLADLLVIPSRFEEPFSMVAIEAMASGVPVMALRRGGMGEYMEDGHNALVLPPGTTPEEMADAIRLASGFSGLGQIAAMARNTVCSRFTWQQVATETEALYDRILAGASS